MIISVAFLCVFLLYRFSNYSNVIPGGDHFVYLADSFRQGRFDLSYIPDSYVDVFEHEGKKYLNFLPVPGIILLPLALVFKTSFTQLPICQLIGALNVVLFWILLRTIKTRTLTAVFVTLFFGFGTVHWFAADLGTAWYLAHITAVFFLLISLIMLFSKKSLIIVGLFFSAAFLSRGLIIFAAPFLPLIAQPDIKIFSKRYLSSLLLLFFGFAPLLLFDFYYNYARFGSIFNTGFGPVYDFYIHSSLPYTYLRTVVPKDFPHFGLFDVRNIPLHIHAMLLSGPEPSRHFPFFKPSAYGLSLIFTSPFILRLFWLRFTRQMFFLVMAAASIMSVTFFYFAQGWAQFGYRYALDFLPFVILAIAIGMKKKALTSADYLLISLSVIVNLWGIILWHHTAT